MRPARGIDAHRGPQVDLVAVLESRRAHPAPPIQVGRLPMLERALQALVARQPHVVRNAISRDHVVLRTFDARSTYVLRTFEVKVWTALAAVGHQRALFADRVWPLEDPVLP